MESYTDKSMPQNGTVATTSTSTKAKTITLTSHQEDEGILILPAVESDSKDKRDKLNSNAITVGGKNINLIVPRVLFHDVAEEKMRASIQRFLLSTPPGMRAEDVLGPSPFDEFERKRLFK